MASKMPWRNRNGVRATDQACRAEEVGQRHVAVREQQQEGEQTGLSGKEKPTL